MPINIVSRNITTIECDAIVAPTDQFYSHVNGTDAEIHAAAGPRLFEACMNHGRLNIGDVAITEAFDLPCKYVIHTIAPGWINGLCRERVALETCYKRCLEQAAAYKCKSIAIPLLSSENNDYPKDQVMEVAMNVIGDHLIKNEMLVYIVVRDKNSFEINKRLYTDVCSYIGKELVDIANGTEAPELDAVNYNEILHSFVQVLTEEEEQKFNEARSMVTELEFLRSCHAYPSLISPSKLEAELENMDKSFSEMLFYYIDMKGMSDVECYKRANVDRKTFSKIKCNPHYKPSKVTAVSFAIALELDMDETQNLLKTAGMTLSRSNKFDVIVGYFISSGNYDINEINETLFQFDQLLLGC